MNAYSALLSPFQLGKLTLKNRMVSAAHANGYLSAGLPGERYQRYHEERARGGLALTVFGGSSNVARDSGAIYGQIYVGDDKVIPHFQSFAKRIHQHGCALICQITHMGRRTSWQGGDWLGTIGPSAVRDPGHHSMPRVARLDDIERIVRCFADAAQRCQEGGLDGCEVLASVHILGQFLSPLSNMREDAYGGSLENRARFMLEALAAVRRRVGPDFVVGLRYTADESNERGLDANEGVAIARLVASTGLVDYLSVNGAYGGTAKGMSEAFPGMATPSAPFLDLARRVRQVSGLPTMQAARITDLATANHAVESGAVDMVGMVRPHVADAAIIAKLMRGEEHRIRPCVGAGACIDRVDLGGEMICVHNVSAGRESTHPEAIDPAPEPRHMVVVGGGPGGLEAARVAALRGHRVTLFEAADRLGGQVLIASRARQRRDLIGIIDWLAAEIEALGVEVICNRFADAADVLALQPDVVLIATGGVPMKRLEEGGEDHAKDTWELLLSGAKPKGSVVIYDEVGGHNAISLAETLGSAGVDVTLVTPYRRIGNSLGGQTYPQYLESLYRSKVRMQPDTRVTGVDRKEHGFAVKTRNLYSREAGEQSADLVVIEQGTMAMTDLFEELRPSARNAGVTDWDALADGRPQPESVSIGSFDLHLLGDALSSRDIHSAMFDGNRLSRTM